MHPDGKRFVYAAQTIAGDGAASNSTDARLVVIQNWPALLREAARGSAP
jgi:hypothetical protein